MGSLPPRTVPDCVKLACPSCKAVFSGGGPEFSCASCGASFPASNGIPCLLVRPMRRGKRRIALYYDRAAPGYETGHGIGLPGGAWSIENKYLPFLKSRLRGDELLLEIGAGTGAITAHLRRMVKAVVPADISTRMLEQGLLLGRFNSAVAADAEALPFPDSSFDAVAAISALSYCTGKDRALLEVGRVLKPGGVFLLIDMNYLLHLPYHLMAMVEFWKSWRWIGPLLESTPWSWKRRVKSAGLCVLEEFEFNWVPHRSPRFMVRLFAALDSALSRVPLAKRLAMRIALAASKPEAAA